MFFVLLFRGVLAPFTHSRGSKDAKQGDMCEWDWRFKVGTGRTHEYRRVMAARSVLVETAGKQLMRSEAGTSNRKD